MSKLTDDLFALQGLISLGESASAEQRGQIETLRAGIPAPIAAHFFRQLTNGRRGVAYVRNGVCGGCHLRLAHGLAHMLGRSNELLICESCGAFIALAPDAQPVARPAPMRKAQRVIKEFEAIAS